MEVVEKVEGGIQLMLLSLEEEVEVMEVGEKDEAGIQLLFILLEVEN